MKRLVIFLIILSVAAGIAVSLCYALLPSDYILCYSVCNGDTLYSIIGYQYGVYLKKSDADGIVFSVRLKHQDGRYKSVIDADGRLYTMAEAGGRIIVDEYASDGAYIGEMMSLQAEEMGITECGMSRFISQNEGESSKLFVDVVLIAGNQVLIYPILKGKEQPEILYNADLEDGSDLVWAQRGTNGLFLSDSAGRLYLLSDAGMQYPIDIGKESVAFEPMVSGQQFFFVDLSNVSLVGYYTLDLGDYGITILQVYNNPIMKSGFEIDDGTTFSELRDLSISSDLYDNCMICGKMKSERKYGNVYAYNMSSGKITTLPEPGFEIYRCVLVFFGTAVAVFAALTLIALTIRRVLSARKVIVKQVIFSIVTILVFCVMIRFYMTAKVSNFVFSQASALLTNTLDYISLNISGDEFRDGGLTDEQRDRFRRFESRKMARADEESELITEYINAEFRISFVEVARLTDGAYKYEYYTNQKPGADASYFIGGENLSLLTDMKPGTDIITSSREYNAEWLEAACPIFDSGGDQVGFIQIGSKMDSLTDEIRSFSKTITFFAMLVTAVISALFIVILAGLLRPLGKLKEAVSKVANGHFSTALTVNSNDELQDIAASFTNMSLRLEKNFWDITTISEAYKRYLPKGFFRMMGKKSVLDVDPGDHIIAELTYLFIGIEQPDGLSEEDSFSDFNRIYRVTSEVLSVTGGAIQSFSDRLMTCIFVGGAEAAAEAALIIQEKLRGYPDVKGRITVSAQNSAAVIGVIGSDEAMKTITVSPAIDLQPSLAEIISRFGLTFIVTERVFSELKAAKMNVCTRRLGGVNELLGDEDQSDEAVYEIIDGCPDDEKMLKMASLRSYELALDAARENNYSLARMQLIRVLRVNRNDLVARFMLKNISSESEEYDSERNERNERNEQGKIGLEISS